VTCYQLSQLDCIEWLRSLPSESVDLVITDPAYESLEKHRSKGTTTRLKGSWFDIFPNSRFHALFRELFRVLKRDAHCYVFCDSETMFVAKPITEAAGFRFWKPLVWDKVSIGMGYHYRASCEFILFLEKGKRKLNDLGVRDVITSKAIRGGYPTEKPVAVSEVLVLQSSVVGELVVDPFMGSGSVGEAALRGARSFAGCDVGDAAHAATRARLAGYVEGNPFVMRSGQRGLFEVNHGIR